MANLINEVIEKSKWQPKRELPQQKVSETGAHYYDELPEGSILINCDDITKGILKDKTPYLVHSFHSNTFQCYRIKESIPEWLFEFIDLGRVYVYC
jgi:hypothetical protein